MRGKKRDILLFEKDTPPRDADARLPHMTTSMEDARLTEDLLNAAADHAVRVRLTSP